MLYNIHGRLRRLGASRAGFQKEKGEPVSSLTIESRHHRPLSMRRFFVSRARELVRRLPVRRPSELVRNRPGERDLRSSLVRRSLRGHPSSIGLHEGASVFRKGRPNLLKLSHFVTFCHVDCRAKVGHFLDTGGFETS